jgi:transcriptional regulator with XRE-family HTH domain/predicted Fe-Mo cluster-binding NifX family protein
MSAVARKTIRERENQAGQMIATRIRELRKKYGFSLRVLADISGLNVNTLSLIENGRNLPSVSTLTLLSDALKVPISTFFTTSDENKHIVFTRRGQESEAGIGNDQMVNLARDLAGNSIQPFLVTLDPGMGSGERMIVHTGHEFVYCLEGSLRYQIEEEEYLLDEGDSLVFESHLSHCWNNISGNLTKMLLIILPEDSREDVTGRHMSLNQVHKEKTMKIAVITEDGKKISQHFGRALYYLVLTIEDGKVVNREMREKLGHAHFASEPHEGDHHGAGHGMDAASHTRHTSMADAISDCEVLLCGGMGQGAYESVRRLNIQPYVTDLRDIDTAVKAYLDGTLVDHTELLH